MSTDGIQLPTNRTGEKLKSTIAGTVKNAADGNVQHVRLDNGNGTYLGEAAAPVRIDPTGTTPQPVTLAAAPLPTDAATESEQQTQTAHLAAIETAVEALEPAGLTDAQLRATAIPVSGTVTATGPLTDAQLRATSVPVRKPLVGRASANGTPITTATGTAVVAAPAAGNHLRIHRLWLTNAASQAVLCEWRDGAAGSRRYPAYLLQGAVVSPPLDGGWDLTTATALYLQTDAAGSIHWHVDYETVAD